MPLNVISHSVWTAVSYCYVYLIFFNAIMNIQIPGDQPLIILFIFFYQSCSYYFLDRQVGEEWRLVMCSSAEVGARQGSVYIGRKETTTINSGHVM